MINNDGVMYVIEIVQWSDPRAAALRQSLSSEMGERYADREAIPGHLPPGFFVSEESVMYVGLCSRDQKPVGHIAVRRLGDEFEIKNMYVLEADRGQGAAELLLTGAETAATSAGAIRIVLQTGDRQPEAVSFYQKMGYQKIPVFEPYTSMEYSNCFEKVLA